jgi:hypothetical protein
MNSESYNAGMERKRKFIHDSGVPTFGKSDVSIAFNCMGCRKRKEGFRMKIWYQFEKKKNPKLQIYYTARHRNLGQVCSEVCYSMVVMRMS